MEIKPSPFAAIFESLAMEAVKSFIADPDAILTALGQLDDWFAEREAPDGHRIVHGAIEAHKYGKITTKQAKAVINQFIKDPVTKSAMVDEITVKPK